MDSEIDIIQRRFLRLYQEQYQYLDGKPTPFLTDLNHQSQDLLSAATFSRRAAAQINHAATTLILEERKHQ